MRQTKTQKRIMRHNRIRAKLRGTSSRPRLAVFKSNRFTYAQIIDDESGKTLTAVSDYAGKKTSNIKKTKNNKTDKANETGQNLAEVLKKMGIDSVVFDRGGFKYHGRVKALAESLRKAGIKI